MLALLCLSVVSQARPVPFAEVEKALDAARDAATRRAALVASIENVSEVAGRPATTSRFELSLEKAAFTITGTDLVLGGQVVKGPVVETWNGRQFSTTGLPAPFARPPADVTSRNQAMARSSLNLTPFSVDLLAGVDVRMALGDAPATGTVEPLKDGTRLSWKSEREATVIELGRDGVVKLISVTFQTSEGASTLRQTVTPKTREGKPAKERPVHQVTP
jgi:hypothetical protein